MTDNLQALLGARIFDGTTWYDGSGLLIEDGRVIDLGTPGDLPSNAERVQLDGGILVPGLIDLQVNGGGGVLFNNGPSLETLQTICSAHMALGTTALLPTLITGGPETTAAAVAAGIEAAAIDLPGFLGLHLEGPHLDSAKSGAHDAALIRRMDDDDLADLLAARQHLPGLMVTVAPEAVTLKQMQDLTNAGILVSLGHSSVDLATSLQAMASGAHAVTHLFNAMSPLGHREPGLVGAALSHGAAYAGLIADGHHVSPKVIAIALRAKAGPGHIFLVSDAMATVGTDLDSFDFGERVIFRDGDRLSLADGTLAGAHLDLLTAVRYLVDEVNVELGEALRMGSLYPAQCLGVDASLGHLQLGAFADCLHLDQDLNLRRVWKRGQVVRPPSGDGH